MIEAQVRAEYEAQAQELYDRELARAREEGLESATRDAQAAAANDVTKLREEITSRVESAVNALQAAHAEALAKLEASVGEVTFAALCRLVGRQMTAKSFVLEQVVRACSQLRVDTVATARLHPRDVQTLSDLLQGQELRLHTLGLKVVPDASLTLGGCIIEADSGQFDGGLENQLRRLHAALAQPAPRADATKPPDEGG
jgi:flagellar biosynthesis/type III secretory pathway protein FliH